DLFFSERANGGPADADDADRDALAEQWHSESRTIVSALDRCARAPFCPTIFGIGHHVGNMHGAAHKHSSANKRLPTGNYRLSFHPCAVLRRDAIARGDAIAVTFTSEDKSKLCLAQA